jgi:hypothetical protein
MGLFVMRTRQTAAARQTAAGRLAAKRSNAAARQKRMTILMRKREPKIPMEILRALAASGLPPHKKAYNARLQELLLKA